MEYIFNAYFNIGADYDIDTFREELEKYYKEYSKVRLIIDLDGKEITMKHAPVFKKFKQIFDEKDLGIENLLETIVICEKGFKRTVIKGFLSIPGFRPKRPVHFFP